MAERFASTTLTTARLGGMAQRGLVMDVADILSQDGGVVRRHGGVDDKSCKIIALIRFDDGFATDGGGYFRSVCVGTC
jgi:hypothetical protein